MNNRIEYVTSLQGFPNATVRELAEKRGHPDAAVELTLRAMDSNWFINLLNPYEAITICLEELKLNPQHNFFHLALGILEENTAEQKKHLISAALCTEPCGRTISAQAAYRLAGLTYLPWDKDDQASGKAFAESQAWFTLALILKHKKAIYDFDQHGRFRTDGEFKSVNNYVPTQVTILTCLALKHFPLRRLTRAIQTQNPDFQKTLTHAFNSTTFEDLNNPKSAIRCMLTFLFERTPELYYFYFTYCYQFGLIDKAYTTTLLKLLAEYLPDDLLKAKKLANYALSHLERGAGQIPMDSYLYPLLPLTPQLALVTTNPVMFFTTQTVPTTHTFPAPIQETSVTDQLTPIYQRTKS